MTVEINDPVQLLFTRLSNHPLYFIVNLIKHLDHLVQTIRDVLSVISQAEITAHSSSANVFLAYKRHSQFSGGARFLGGLHFQFVFRICRQYFQGGCKLECTKVQDLFFERFHISPLTILIARGKPAIPSVASADPIAKKVAVTSANHSIAPAWTTPA